ncbi:class I SAM-dependent RNA methyltransferase [Pseudonocardia lacus]|uniref:class I SAM-dependent RNA methyltransferase n=1 Tax=Pseudonocardia lacus TaxID=2835865 RepID=UPI001BDBC71C|nr:TRAM domain-containing protein [Pseudonocardia lacus]
MSGQRGGSATQRERLDWTDRVLDLEVGPIAHGGHCVARHEGRVVFVRHALPGELVRAVVDEDGGGSYCRADAVAVLRASPDRVEAPCDWARAGGCGGCDLQHADPAAQRALKAEVLAEQLRRLAGIERRVVVEELPGGPLGWRHRVRLAVDGLGVPGLRAHRSHDVLPIADCPIAPPGALAPVLAGRFAPGSEVEVARDADGAVHVGTGPDAGPLVQRAAGREWALTPGTFWQVHPALPDALAGVVEQWARAPRGGTAWDLYGGVGLFAAVLAGQVGRDGRVVVVESSRQAVSDGRAALADLPQVRWRAGRVEHLLAGLTDLAGPPDVVVADPPRRGLGRELVAALCAHRPERVVHVACDPAALARDVALFDAGGYRLAELRAFDAFPMTHHFECVALLERLT